MTSAPLGPTWISSSLRSSGRRSVCWLKSSSCGLLWTAIASSMCFGSPRSRIRFVQPVDGSVVGEEPGTKVIVAPPALASNILPTVFAVRPEGEWRRVRPSPFTANVCRARTCQVYIDSLELQKIPQSEAEQLPGTISRDPTGIRVAADHFGKVGALEKDVLRNLYPMTFGIRMIGNSSRLEPPCCYMLRHGVLLMVRPPVTWLTRSSFHTFWLLLAPSICGGTEVSCIPVGWGRVCVSKCLKALWIKTARGCWRLRCPPQRKRLYSSTVSVVSSLLGISRTFGKAPKIKVIIFCGGWMLRAQRLSRICSTSWRGLLNSSPN